MKTQLNTLSRCLAAVVLGAGLFAGHAHALTVDLATEQFNATMPNGDIVTMWGYRLNGGAAQSPGAQIVVPAGDTTLTINLTNTLPMPTSIIVHGMNQSSGTSGTAAFTGMQPVYTDNRLADTNTTATTCAILSSNFCRLRSMTHEAAAAAGTTNGTASYTFTNVKPGTYMYQSGTLPQIQVQMGLYGMATKNAVDGVAPTTTTAAVPAQPYAGVAVDNEVKLVFSEVDPVIHAAVAGGTFTGSTLDYQPKYYLTHAYDATGATATQLNSTAANQVLNMNYVARNLIRMVNAGLQSRVPTLSDGSWYVTAEDGNPYPFAREQYTAFMPAAKTMDVFLSRTAPAAGDQTATTLSVFDRRMAHSTTGVAAGGNVDGQFVQLKLLGTYTPPVLPVIPAINVAGCATAGTQGVAYACTATSNLASTYSLVAAPLGMSIDPATGAISWTPTNDQAQRPANATVTNPVTVRMTVTGGANAGQTADGSFNVVVANVNDAPTFTTAAKSYRFVTPFNGPLNSPVIATNTPTFTVAAANGLLVGAVDMDGDTLKQVITGQPSAGNGTVTANADGSYTLANYTAPAVAPNATPTATDRTFTFTYVAQDNAPTALTPGAALSSAPQTVTVTLHRNLRPVATNTVSRITLPATARTTPTDVIALSAIATDPDNSGGVNGGLNYATLLALQTSPLPFLNNMGSLSVNASGMVVFTPRAGGITTGPTNVNYTFVIRDNDGAISNTANIEIRIP